MPAEALPTELWLRVASFIPDHHLSSLAVVNHFFHGIWTDRIFRHLLLDEDRPARLEAKLKRLRDPNVRRLVQSVAVYPRAIRSACIRSGRNKKKVVGTRCPQTRFRDDVASLSSGEDLELADLFLESLADMPNCGELQIEWESPSIAEACFCLPLLKALMLSIGPQLRALSLSMALDVLSSLVMDMHRFPQLEGLDLELASNMVDPERTEDAAKHQETLARFINNLSPTLRCLSITSLGHFRLCTLFNHLAVFAQLGTLRIQLPLDLYHLDDTSGLNRFLRAHTAISHLSLTPVHCCNRYHALCDPAITRWPDADTWLHGAFADVEFHHLRTLELGLNTAGGAPRVLPATAYMGKVARNVGCLTILGVIMSVDDLDLVLRPFAANGKRSPKTVVLEVHVLSQEVLNTLASTLPQLETLDLSYSWAGKVGGRYTAPFIGDMTDSTWLWRMEDESASPRLQALLCIRTMGGYLLNA